MSELVWIIDEEWKDYEEDKAILAKELPNAEVRFSSYDYEKDLEEFGKDADFILAQIYVPIPEEVINKLTKCKGIAVYGGGYDRIDIKAARAKGISVTNVSGYCIEDIAEYVMAAIFKYGKMLDGYGETMAAGNWGAQAVDEPIHRLSTRTLLIAGCGRIGSHVGKLAQKLGMTVLGYDPYVSKERLAERGIEKVELEEGFRKADYISVHIKLDEKTKGVIGKDLFDVMKPDAILVNTSRGAILDEAALIEAVKAGKLGGAVLDVVTNEPPSVDDPILHTPGIQVTPHISYISKESYSELKRRTVYNGLAMFRGQDTPDLVN